MVHSFRGEDRLVSCPRVKAYGLPQAEDDIGDIDEAVFVDVAGVATTCYRIRLENCPVLSHRHKGVVSIGDAKITRTGHNLLA